MGQVTLVMNLSPAEERLLHDATQYFTGVWSDLVAVVEGGGGDGELLVRVPDYKVSVGSNDD
jgi:hypothetical protein